MTIVELLIVAGVIGLLAALLLPAVQHARERSRQVGCRNNLRQLGIATHAHLSSHGTFPLTSVVSGDIVNGRFVSLFKSVSPHRHLLGYIDPKLYRKIDWGDISTPTPNRLPTAISDANREVITTASLPVFLCPSDSMPLGGNNYRANMGKGPGLYHPEVHIHGDPPMDEGNRTGAFINGNTLQPQDFADGLSMTVMYSERTIGDRDPGHYTPYRDFWISPVDFSLSDDAIRICRDHAVPNPARHDSFAGTTWFYGGFGQTWYNHVVTPNSPIPDCSSGVALGGSSGLYTARSFHPGGVFVCLADGSVRFISDQIDTFVWRAVGTRAGEEIVSGNAL
ncbi:MAG: DUF1559 domain-containing protein [Maioricimonas sp. JB049]